MDRARARADRMVTECEYVTQFRIKVDKIRRLFDAPFSFKSAPGCKRAARSDADSTRPISRGTQAARFSAPFRSWTLDSSERRGRIRDIRKSGAEFLIFIGGMNWITLSYIAQARRRNHRIRKSR